MPFIKTNCLSWNDYIRTQTQHELLNMILIKIRSLPGNHLTVIDCTLQLYKGSCIQRGVKCWDTPPHEGGKKLPFDKVVQRNKLR